MKLILGSQSKSRKSLLTKMGYDFEIIVPGIDEKAIRDPDPKKLTIKIANKKADEVIKHTGNDSVVITSDSVVVVNGEIAEKPVSKQEAYSRLTVLSKGIAQTLVSAVVVVNTKTGQRFDGVSKATVIFNPIPEDNIKKFVESGDTFNHAGSFAVEHPFFSPRIKEIKGEMETIVGLPKKLTEKLLKQSGYK
jgi:septum formation protein